MYKFHGLTESIFEKTRLDWEKELSSVKEVFSTVGYEQCLDSAELRLTKYSRDLVTMYCLSPAAVESGPAVALIDLVHALPGHKESYIKLMALRMTPRLDSRMPITEKSDLLARHKEIAKIASFVVASVLEKALTESCQKIKVFTTVQADVNVLMTAASSMDRTLLRSENINVDTYGNWIEFSMI